MTLLNKTCHALLLLSEHGRVKYLTAWLGCKSQRTTSAAVGGDDGDEDQNNPWRALSFGPCKQHNPNLTRQVTLPHPVLHLHTVKAVDVRVARAFMLKLVSATIGTHHTRCRCDSVRGFVVAQEIAGACTALVTLLNKTCHALLLLSEHGRVKYLTAWFQVPEHHLCRCRMR